MRADHVSYKRAAMMSLLGMVLQGVLGLTFLLYSIFFRDTAATTASIYMLLGVPVWIVLAIVFDQHRRERLEAAEAEAFAASDAATSSVFEQQAGDLRVAERRLRFMHRWLIPAASLALGATMVVAGVLRFLALVPAQSVKDAARADQAIRTWQDAVERASVVQQRGWPMALGLGAAFIGFVFARYVAVMARQKPWTNLRAGAGFAVGSALMGLTIAVGHLVDITGPDVILRWLVAVFPALLVVFGCEIFLNFVLDVYRPRAAGEYARPAFESRLLGFVAAPDQLAQSIGEAINYQFGYDVAGSWVYRLLSRVLLRVLAPVALLVLWGISSLTVIRPHQMGMVLTNGKFSRVIGPGLHFKLPWPFETVEIPEYIVRDAQGNITYESPTVTGVRTLNIGSLPPQEDKPVLWTNEHAQEEVFFLVQPGVSDLASTVPSDEATNFGLAQIAIEVPVHYAIDDVEAYELLGPAQMRDDFLKAVAQRVLMQYASTQSVGGLLSERRGTISQGLRERIEQGFIAINPKHDGKPVVRVLQAGIAGVHPPKDASVAFEGVVVAEQKYYARKKNAEAQASEILSRSAGNPEQAGKLIIELNALDAMASLVDGKPNPKQMDQRETIRKTLAESGGEVSSVLARASAERWDRHMDERTRLVAYQGRLGTYLASPALFRVDLYFDTMLQALADGRLFVFDRAVPLEVQSDNMDRDTSALDVLGSQDQNK